MHLPLQTTVPVTSPKPTRSFPLPHQPRRTTRSPSSRNVRDSPVGSTSGSVPPRVSSMRLPACVRSSAPEMVPDANEVAGAHRRAVRRDVRELLRGRPVEPLGELDPRHRVRLRASRASAARPRDAAAAPTAGRSSSAAQDGDPAASPCTSAGASASRGTSHGDTDVANDLPRNGPSGWYSKAWMSRADQSFTSTNPNSAGRPRRS